jgi:ubiquinone/menaquinone biosynthesis C-methylase UbiE
MPWEYSDEYYREYTRTTWNESAGSYVDWMRNLAPFRSDLVARLGAQPGERVLDLGTGPGEPAMTVAAQVGPTGRATGVDLSDKMVELARQAAQARNIANVEFLSMDCAELRFPDGAFDAAVSNFGFQIFTDPEKAAREAYRVLRVDGRIAVSVWSTADKVPFLHAIIGPMLEHAEPDETGYLPTPYEIGGPGEMAAFLRSAGFREAREYGSRHMLRFPDEDTYLDSILKATPIGHSLSEETDAVQREVLAKARANLQAWRTPTGFSVPAECVLVTGRK